MINIQINGSQSARVMFGLCRISRRKRKKIRNAVRSNAAFGGINPTARTGVNVVITSLEKRPMEVQYSWIDSAPKDIHRTGGAASENFTCRISAYPRIVDQRWPTIC